MARGPHIAYLFSRYPVVSQTFCDSETLALEAAGVPLTIASLNSPPNAFRHERLENLLAETVYPPPSKILRARQRQAETDGSWKTLASLVQEHDAQYGPEFKAETRARNALFVADALARRGVDHIHVHFANRATHTALFIKKLGIPFSFTAHAQDFMVDLGSDDLLRELCREAEFVVAVSDFSRGLLCDTCPDSVDKIHRVYNGIRPDDFPVARRDSPANKLRIVTVGRLIEFKGFHHLIDACKTLADHGIDVECVIAGDGPLRESLEQQSADAGLANAIRFAGVLSQEQIKDELQAADVFALACIVDSKGASDILPTVIMEAMAARLPIVSTALVGVPEMVIDGKTGFLVEPGAVQPLADALQKLAADPALRQQLGDAGRQLAEERFALDVTSAQLNAHFNQVAKPGSHPAPTAKTAYLLNEWPGAQDDWLDEEATLAAANENLLVLAATLGDRFRSKTQVPNIDFFPDNVALESLAQDGTDPDHWRALYLARLLDRRGIQNLHAARPSAEKLARAAAKLAKAPINITIGTTPEARAPRQLKLGPLKLRLGPGPEALAKQRQTQAQQTLKNLHP